MGGVDKSESKEGESKEDAPANSFVPFGTGPPAGPPAGSPILESGEQKDKEKKGKDAPRRIGNAKVETISNASNNESEAANSETELSNSNASNSNAISALTNSTVNNNEKENQDLAFGFSDNFINKHMKKASLDSLLNLQRVIVADIMNSDKPVNEEAKTVFDAAMDSRLTEYEKSQGKNLDKRKNIVSELAKLAWVYQILTLKAEVKPDATAE
jgi:hypothetical protein